jgi:FtsH-binding integral membrane protein
LTSDFSSNSTIPTFPGAGIIADIAAASSTPTSVPFVLIASFLIYVASLVATYMMRKYQSTSVFFKAAIITGLMGVAIAVDVFDFWMMGFFLILAIAVTMASRPQGSVI